MRRSFVRKPRGSQDHIILIAFFKRVVLLDQETKFFMVRVKVKVIVKVIVKVKVKDKVMVKHTLSPPNCR